MKYLVALLSVILLMPTHAQNIAREWVDVEVKEFGVDPRGTLRLNRIAHGEGSASYRVSGAGLLGLAGFAEIQLDVTDDGNGTYTHTMTTSWAGQWQVVEISKPLLYIGTFGDIDSLADEFQANTAAWGPEAVEQNADGIHEPREWIRVRISWNGGTAGQAGTWTGNLLPTITRQYNFVAQPAPFMIANDGQPSEQFAPVLVYEVDDAVANNPQIADVQGSSAGSSSTGPGFGDYVGPLPLHAMAGTNDWFVYEFVILELGPTIGGPGNDGIGPDEGFDPDNPDGNNGDGDGGEDPPSEEEPPNEADTTFDCVEEFFVDFLAVEAVAAFLALTDFTGDAIASTYIVLDIPGGNTHSVNLSSDPLAGSIADAAPGLANAIETMRLVIRSTLIVMFSWITLRSTLGVLINW